MAFARRALHGTSNITQFVQELKDFDNLTLKRIAVGAHKKLIMEAFRRIVRRTPVDDGPVKEYARARMAWRITLVHPGRVETRSSSVIGDAEASLRRLQPFQKVFIVNLVPYINVLEYGGFVPRNPGLAGDRWGHEGELRVSAGFSTQAPQGIVRITFEELRRLPTIKVSVFGYKGVRP